jgi:CheY-like chemotaxis protein
VQTAPLYFPSIFSTQKWRKEPTSYPLFVAHSTWHCFGNKGAEMRSIIIHSENSNLRTLLCSLLASDEVEVVEARSRQELTARCRRHRFDKVVTDDVRMFMNGSEILREIRHNNKNTRIFVLSHDASEHSVLSLLEAGVTEFLSLPITIERLQKKLKK